MASTESLTTHELTPTVAEAMATIDGDYNTYWPQFGELYGGDIKVVAEKNQDKQTALTKRLYDPTKRTGNGRVDNLDPADIAEEWYMGIGSLNQLKGATAAMLLASATMWESPPVNQKPDPNITTRFITEVGTIRRGQIPERMKRALKHDPVSLAHISLAGQATLDIARASEAENINGRILAADLSFQINNALFKQLVEKPVLSEDQKRILSDSLKTQYDARFKYIELRKHRGDLSDSDHEAVYNQALAEQVNDTLRASDKMPSGYLYEHYYIALMRYGLNTWQEQTNYDVSSTTRRQDEPHDDFEKALLPKFAYDAVVADPSQGLVKFIQLKMQKASSSYASGIDVLDDILLDHSFQMEKRDEIMTGLGQMQGLLRELIIGEPYQGDDKVIKDHIDKILSRLNI